MIDFLSLICNVGLYCTLRKCSLCSSVLLKDRQPHPNPDSGAHHGQSHLPSDPKMCEFYVSIPVMKRKRILVLKCEQLVL